MRDKETKLEDGEASHTLGGGWRSLAHTEMQRRRGYLRRGKRIGGERFVSGRGECGRVKR